LFWGNTGNGNVLGNPVFSFLICIDSTSLGYITTSNVSFLLNIFTFAYAHKYIQLPTCIFTCLLWKIPNATYLKQTSSVFPPPPPPRSTPTGPYCLDMRTLSGVQLFATPRTAAHQTPLSMGCSRQEYWSGLPFPSPTALIKRINFNAEVLLLTIFSSHRASAMPHTGNLNVDQGSLIFRPPPASPASTLALIFSFRIPHLTFSFYF